MFLSILWSAALLFAIDSKLCIQVLENQLAQNAEDSFALYSLADLYLEQGNPRGEFIALQIAKEVETESAQREKIEYRANHLLAQYFEEWNPGDRAVFRRGLFWKANLSLQQYFFLRPIDRTIQHLKLRISPKEILHPEFFRDNPAVLNLKTLDLKIFNLDFSDLEIQVFLFELLSSPYLKRIEAIRGHPFLQTILPFWGRFERLSHFSVDLNYDGVDTLLRRSRTRARTLEIQIRTPNIDQQVNAQQLMEAIQEGFPVLEAISFENLHYQKNSDLIRTLMWCIEFYLDQLPSLKKITLGSELSAVEEVVQRLKSKGVQICTERNS